MIKHETIKNIVSLNMFNIIRAQSKSSMRKKATQISSTVNSGLTNLESSSGDEIEKIDKGFLFNSYNDNK